METVGGISIARNSFFFFQSRSVNSKFWQILRWFDTENLGIQFFLSLLRLFKIQIQIVGSAYICMENPIIPGRIQMEQFIPVEIFRKKGIPFEVLPFSRFYQNDGNFSYHLSG